jgi:glycosyltransferase involved in cell wall biosynthesis
MKILIVRMYADCLNITNYNCQEVGLAKALIRKGNICDIVLYTDKETSYEEDLFFDDEKSKIHIYYLKAKNILKNCFFERKLYDIVKQYDRVQTAEYDQIANVKLRKILGDKLVIYHGPYKSKYTKGYNLKCIFSDFYYLFHSEYKKTKCLAKSELAANFLRKKGFNNISIVGVGLDNDRFKNEKEKYNKLIEKIKKQRKKDNSKYLLYIGKIEDRRNILMIIEIFSEIKKEKNVKLILVGKGEKKYKAKCLNLAKKRRVLDDIIYIEELPQNELIDLYKIADVFLLPTKYEIFGMVLLEALYFELPVVTTLNGGSSTLKNCLICNYDKNNWINIILKLLYDNDFNKKFSNKLKNVNKEEYMWNGIAEKIYSAYIEG